MYKVAKPFHPDLRSVYLRGISGSACAGLWKETEV